MEVDEAYQHVMRSSTVDVGKFYFGGHDVGLGKGKIYKAVRFPIYIEDQALFRTAKGLVYVLTHECDLDEENRRFLNTDVLICPIIDLRHLVAALLEAVSVDQLISFLTNLGARNISRALYLPHCPPTLTHGGVLFLNQIASTHVSCFELEDAESVAMLTAYGLTIVDQMIENHLLRPKVDPVAFQT